MLFRGRIISQFLRHALLGCTVHVCTEECDRKETWVWDDKKQVQFVKALISLADVAQHVREATACDTPDSLDLACGLLNSLLEKAAREADMVKLLPCPSRLSKLGKYSKPSWYDDECKRAKNRATHAVGMGATTEQARQMEREYKHVLAQKKHSMRPS
jgi:hypothetical protein